METSSLPLIIVIAHIVNIFCLLLLIRSGIQILFDHPKLYWTDDTTDDNHWLRFGKKIMPKDKLWTSLDEAEDPGGFALPGGTHNLGAARHWHFTMGIIWLVTGMIYVGFLLFSGSWQRIVPTEWGIFSDAVNVFVSYLTFNIQHESLPYNALQQLTYFGVIFILTPISILSGIAMSPALIARFPGYLKLFGNRRQVARSIHFICMVLFSIFILTHITITMALHFSDSVKLFVSGDLNAKFETSLMLFVSIIILLITFNIWANIFTFGNQIRIRKILTAFYTPVVRLLFGWMDSRQHYSKEDISAFHRVNGYPPKTPEYEKLKESHFKDWKLKVGGLVDNPLELSLEEIKDMPKQEQIVKHNCIQGWTAVAEWGGVRMDEIIKLCKPNKKAKYVLFHSYDCDDKGAYYYSGLRVRDMKDKQTILAYEMNYKTLPIEYGAPLRLRCERKYGYKMAKYLKSIEFVDSFENIGQGRGGYREDTVFFDWEASI